MSEVNLLGCPFCGESNAVVCTSSYLETPAYAVSCRTRDCHGAIYSLGYGLFPTEAEAIAAWNHRTTPAADDVERIELPLTMPGHWDTRDGWEMATEYLKQRREDLGMGDMSDLQLANAQYLVSRDDLALIHYQTAAKERIRWLSAQLAAARKALAATQSGRVAELENALRKCAERFREYTESHFAKANAITNDDAARQATFAKSNRNREMAEMVESVLSGMGT